jgi:hypothetical protein
MDSRPGGGGPTLYTGIPRPRGETGVRWKESGWQTDLHSTVQCTYILAPWLTTYQRFRAGLTSCRAFMSWPNWVMGLYVCHDLHVLLDRVSTCLCARLDSTCLWVRLNYGGLWARRTLWTVPVCVQGWTLPVCVQGWTLPVCVLGWNLPVCVQGWTVPVCVQGWTLPVCVQGWTLPVCE